MNKNLEDFFKKAKLLGINTNNFKIEYNKYEAVLTYYSGEDEIVHIPPVDGLGPHCFITNHVIKQVYVPNTVKYIDYQCFEKCTQLEKVVLTEGLETIENRAFDTCLQLTSLKLPEQLKTLGAPTFSNSGLKHIDIPENIREIPQYFCYRCNKLESIRFGSKITAIGEHAFTECRSLKEVTLPGTINTLWKNSFTDNTIIKIPDKNFIGTLKDIQCTNEIKIMFHKNFEDAIIDMKRLGILHVCEATLE